MPSHRHPKETVYKIMSMVEAGKTPKAISLAVKLPLGVIYYYQHKVFKMLKLMKKRYVDKQLKLPF